MSEKAPAVPIRVTVMGLGLFGGGVAIARFWARQGALVTVTDLREEDELSDSLAALAEFPNIRFVLGEHLEEDFRSADRLIVNPAVKPENAYLQIAREAGVRLDTEIGTALRSLSGSVVAVSGSNGKSTTTALIHAMLQAAHPGALLGGNIGGSLLDLPDGASSEAPAAVELSSFQLYYLAAERFAPSVAVLTNLSPNHLDWHVTYAAYAEAKRNLLRFQSSKDWAVLPAEDQVLRSWADGSAAQVMLFGEVDPKCSHAAFVRDEAVWVRWDGDESLVLPLVDLQLPGRHNRLNALAAVAAVTCLGQRAETIRDGARRFHGLPHRLETVAKVNGVTYINDSIATTPESSLAALEAFDQPVVLLLGGYDKGLSFQDLTRAVSEKAAGVVLYGAAAEVIRQAMPEHSSVPLCQVDSLAEAVSAAAGLCPEGGVVILSPACASYDQFPNFTVRGETFRGLVKSLKLSD